MLDRACVQSMVALMSLSVMFTLSCGTSSKSVVDGGEDGEENPTAVTDLTVETVAPRSVSLRWTAPSVGTGMVYAYDVRYATSPITDGTWSAATVAPAPPAPLPPGMAQTMAVGNLTPQTGYHFAVKSRSPMGNVSPLSNVVATTTVPETEVMIPDSSLQAVVRALISKPTGPIRTSDVYSITELRADEQGIASLVGLEAFASLQFLQLRGNRIEDLSPVAGLANLVTVGASGNRIVDVSPLSGLTRLEQLSLGDNRITNVQPLSGLAALTSLYLNGNGIGSVAALGGLTRLTSLYVSGCGLTDVAPIQGLTNLSSLALDANQITDLAPLVANDGLGAGDEIWVRMNPLSQDALSAQVPALEARGVTVH